MSELKNLNTIETRHGHDRWRDALFIGLAVLLTALSIGAVTSQAAGKPAEHAWSVKLVDDHGQSIDTASVAPLAR